MPGGRDLKYVEWLETRSGSDQVEDESEGVSAAERIKRWVQQGGRYLGLCAGAYYGSSFVDFERGTPMQVLGPRTLALFPTVAKGCLVPYSYNSERGARAMAVIPTASGADSSVKVYYNGGCFFQGLHPDDKGTAYTVLAHYDLDFTPVCLKRLGLASPSEYVAIVGGPVGPSGRAVLSGVHIEVDADLVPDSKDTQHYLADLTQDNEQRKLLFDNVLRYLGF
jgi:biotin--protein ligase